MPATEANCPHCLRPLSPGAPKGLCPACLGLSLSELMGEATGGTTMPIPSLATPNERVGDYELLDELGRGGMGVVFRARDLRLNRIVALKLILTGKLASEVEVKRFRLEAEAAAQLEHPCIVPIYEVGESEGRHFFVMKLVEGGTLAEKVSSIGFRVSGSETTSGHRNQLETSNAKPETFAALLAKVARAVHHAHQRGILHRDLKPANILLDPDGEPLVSDFGLARLIEGDSSLTLSGAAVGSPSYMAPEQAAGQSKEITIAADVYSLGAILYELLTGQPPFRADTPMATLRQVMDQEPRRPSSINRRVDRDLETICLKCLQKNPGQRYASAEALAEDLERRLRHEPIRARRNSAWEHARKWARRHPARAGLLLVSVAAVAGFVVQLLITQAKLTHERNLALAQKGLALSEARRAESNAVTARLNLYAADIYVAAQLVEAGRLGTALDLLKQHEPAPGQPDVRGFEWRWLRSQCVGDPARVLDGTSGPIHTLAFSADGRRMASGGRETIRLWNTENWQPLASFPSNSLSAQLENRIQHGLALVERDPKTGLDLLLGRTGSGAKEAASSRPDQADAIRALAWSPDGRTLATAAEKSFVKFWDVASGRMRTWNEAGNEPGKGPVAFLADGRAVALGEATPGDGVGGRNLQCVDPVTGKAVETLASNITAFALSANGRWLATVAGTKEVAVRATSTLLEVARFQANNDLQGSLAVSGDGQRVASTPWLSTRVQIFAASNRWRHVDSGTLNSQVIALSFSPDDRRLAFGMRDSTVRLHDAASGKAMQQFNGHSGDAFAVGWGPGGELISAGQDGTIRLWDLAKPPRETGVPDRMSSFVGSPRGDQFAGVNLEAKIVFWDGRTPETRTVNDRQGLIALAFRPEESALLVAGIPGYPPRTLELWRLADGATLRALPIASTGRILVSPRGDRVVVWSALEAVVYDMTLGTELTRWRAEGMPFRADQKWTNDEGVFTGERLLACTTQGAALWEVATGRCLLTVRPPEGVETGCVAMTQDGALVLTGDTDHRIRVWDARDGRLLRTLAGHGGSVELLAVSPDGRTLASYAQDLLVKLWSLPTGRELMTMPGRIDRCRLLFTPDGLGLAVANAWMGAAVWHADAVK